MKYPIALLAAVLLGGCATQYQDRGFTGGASYTRLAPDVFRVRFGGNGFTSRERTQDFAMLKCADIALANGYSHFVILREGGDTTRTSTGATTYTTGTLTPTAYGGYQATGMSYSMGSDITRHASEFTIQLTRDGPGALDASFLRDSIRRKYGM